VPAFSHVFVVVMENLGYAGAIAVPGFARLAARYASATRYYAFGHPSLPNYLDLTSGSSWGIASDCPTCYVAAPNVASQLQAAHVSWGAYMEGVPSPCWLAPYGPGGYAGKHDPFAYYLAIRDSRAACSHIRPLPDLYRALAGPAAAVPRFVWVTPNLCHDGHDCPPSVAAAWLDGFVGRVVASAAWRHRGVLFVTWDEANGDSSGVGASGRVTAGGGGGRVLTLVIAPGVPAGLRVGAVYDHDSLLATVEDAFGLPLLNGARRAAPLTAFFQARRTPARAGARPARRARA